MGKPVESIMKAVVEMSEASKLHSPFDHLQITKETIKYVQRRINAKLKEK